MSLRNFIFIFILIIAGSVNAQPLKKIENTAFNVNEVLEYRVHYGFIDAGEARLEVFPEMKNMGGRNCYHVLGTGRSLGAFDWFFKVRDYYESYIDADAMVPWLFIRNVDEGGYTIKQNVSFNHINGTATSEKATIKVPNRIQDLISAFYYSRTIPFENLKPGDSISINTYLDDEVFPMYVKYIGKEVLKTKLGKFRCIVFRPYLLEGRVFKEKEGMTVWVTDDKNKIPIRAEAEILVGSVKMDLKGYSGLANPIALVK
jgi:hypothetical protein